MSLAAVDMDNVDTAAVEGEQQSLPRPIRRMPWATKGSATVKGRQGEEGGLNAMQTISSG